MNGYKGDHTFEHSCESDSDLSEADCLPYEQPGKGPIAEGPWQQTPLLLRPSTATCKAGGGLFTNGLFSPDVSAQHQVLPGSAKQQALSLCYSAMDHCADMQQPGSGAAELLKTLHERVAALEARPSSQQEHALGKQLVTSAMPAARGAPSDLVEELDRSLQQLQQACHAEPVPDGSQINAQLVAVRRLLHKRAEQSRAASAAALADAGDAIRLRAELAQLTNRLTGEMAEVRDFVTSETSDICAFVEERIAEALEQAAAHTSQQQQQHRGVSSEATQVVSGPLTVSVLRSATDCQPSSAPAAVMWSPTSSGRGSRPDAAVAADLPHSVRELWQYMQKGMQRLEGLRQHMEEHLAAVRTLCGFADDRIADINQLHERFEERVEDLHASHRDLERKLARLHSEQARSAGQVQALSAVASHLPRQPPAAMSPVSSAASNDERSGATLSPACLRGAAEATTTQPLTAWPQRILLDMGMLALIAVVLLAMAFNNEPHLVAT